MGKWVVKKLFGAGYLGKTDPGVVGVEPDGIRTPMKML